jgi:creatinine amidohydrolase/Fe(II)-dependent formamide hydrolase-like protein
MGWLTVHLSFFEQKTIRDSKHSLVPKHNALSKAREEISFKKTKYTWNDLMKPSSVFMPERFEEQTKSGVFGDPTLATREKGERLVNAAVVRVHRRLDLIQKVAVWCRMRSAI